MGKIVLLYFLGILFPVIGLFGFLLAVFLLVNQYKVYQKTRVWPDLPNMFEESKKGGKSIFGISQESGKK